MRTLFRLFRDDELQGMEYALLLALIAIVLLLSVPMVVTAFSTTCGTIAAAL